MNVPLTASLARVDAFASTHPEYSREGLELLGQGSTNHVVLARRGPAQVVFKIFCEASRKAWEVFGLRHWKSTGLVPELIEDVDSTMIVMSHIPGIYLGESKERDSASVWRQSCIEAGRAIGLLTRVSLTPAGLAEWETLNRKREATLEAYLGRIAELGLRIHAQDPDFKDRFWEENLAFIQAQLPVLYSQPRVLYHQDISNFHVLNGRFTGFFDLEMCRVGCVMLQLGCATSLFQADGGGWEAFRAGWEAGTGETLTTSDLRAAVAAQSLMCWREISRYMSYDGTPGTGYDWASPADPVRYRGEIERTMSMLGVDGY